jgi:phosphohistidine phosphatase
MIKTLYIARHGKSSWDFENIADIDRPLSIRGVNNAYTMAERLRVKGMIPELLLSSPASRALHTAIIYIRTLDLPWESLKINERIYYDSANEIVETIEQTDDHYSSMMVIGHNPAFTELANSLLQQPVDNIPTAGIVTIVFPTGQWKSIRKVKSEKEDFDYPKKQ